MVQCIKGRDCRGALKMHKKVPGFSIVELAIAMTIASILSLLIFGFARQTIRSSARAAAAVEYGLAVSIAYTQLERDLMALTVPESSFAAYKRMFQREKKTQEATSSVDSKSEAAADQKVGEEEKRSVEIPPPFSAIFQSDRLVLFHFTTTNRMPRHKVFVSYNTRVAYRLIPDDQPGMWRLVRAESNNISADLKELIEGKAISHVLMTRLKSVTMKFFVPEEPKEEKQVEGKDAVKQVEVGGEKPKKIIYKELREWNPQALKKAPYLVPAYLEISGVRLDSDGKTERAFMIACKIPVFEWHYERVKKIVQERTKVKKTVLKEKGAASQGGRTGGVKQVPGRPRMKGAR